jgi:hypothetical protein
MDVPHDIVCSLMEKLFRSAGMRNVLKLFHWAVPCQTFQFYLVIKNMVNHFRGHLNIRGIQAISGYVPAFLKISYFVGHVYF